jgi:glycine/D-amino acid oxidase-like deaminating enzyme
MKPITRRALLATGGAAALAAGVGAYKLARPGGAIVPGVSRAKPVLGQTTIPRKADVVIIGGGYVGCHAALFLAERGVSAALCEKGVIAGEASGRSAGLITSLYLDPIKQDLILRSKQLWAGMNERVEADTGYRKPGQLTLFRNQPEQQETEGWLSTVDPAKREPAQFLSTAEIKKLVRQGAEQWSGALWSPEEATAEPTLACPAVAAAAIRKGAAVIQQCAARGIETSGGKVSAVVTEKGTIATSAVILAGGVWSPFFARSIGLDLPQFNAYSSMINVAPFDGPSITMFGNDVCFRQTPDGGYYAFTTNGTAPITPTTLRHLPQLLPSLMHLWDELDPVFSPSTFVREWSIPAQWPLDRPSPFEKVRILQPEIRNARLDAVMARIRKTFPAFAAAKERERWAGALTTTPDNMPVISAVQRVPGLYFGTGIYFGLTMGPAIGEALVDLVGGRTPHFDLRPYRYERFTDGSKLEFKD